MKPAAPMSFGKLRRVWLIPGIIPGFAAAGTGLFFPAHANPCRMGMPLAGARLETMAPAVPGGSMKKH